MSGEHDDVPMWHVEMTRTQSVDVFIEAATEAEARDTAWRVVDDEDWDLTDRAVGSAESARIYVLPEGQHYWTGTADDGHWVIEQ